MRTVITFFYVVLLSNLLLSQPTYFGQNYTHANGSVNCFFNYTVLESAEIGNNPSDFLIFNHVWGLPDAGTHMAYMPHSNGLWFTGAAWSIFDETLVEMDTNLAYNVLNPKQNGTSFEHTVTTSNLLENFSIMDQPLLNGHPEAIFFISKTWTNGVYDTAHVGIRYATSLGKWTIYNEDPTKTLEINSTYNIFIPTAGTSCFKHEAISTCYYTTLDNPLVNGNQYARIFIIHDYTNISQTEGYINDETGLWFDGIHWNIYAEILPNLFIGATFNVLIVADFPTGIQSGSNPQAQLILSPNPVSDQLNIRLNADGRPMIKEITITGMDGQTVIKTIKEWNDQAVCQVDVSALPPGLYLLSIQDGKGIISGKFNIIR